MKKNILFLMMLILLFSCSKHENNTESYSVNLGVYESTGDGVTDFKINLDKGKIIIPAETGDDLAKFENGDRVLVYYTDRMESEAAEDILEIEAKVHYIEKVLSKGILTLTEANADSIGDNAIHVHEEDIWFGKHFLNIYFSYYGYGTTHYINMIKYANDSIDSDGRLMLEFRHNSNGDYYSYVYDGVVSFDMNSLYQPGIDSLPLTVKVTDYDGYVLNWRGTYYFNDQAENQRNINFKNAGILTE